jgi:hypothetical protein
MDAVVFFVIAMAISSMLFYYAKAEAVQTPSGMCDGQSDPEAILRVFLRASLGEEAVLDLGREIHVSGNSEIAECLKIEFDALVLGADPGEFNPLNDRLVQILEAICNPVLEPHLVAIHLFDRGSEKILSIPSEPPDSTELPGYEGSSYLLMLILVPASLPEILPVGTGYLDLGP